MHNAETQGSVLKLKKKEHEHFPKTHVLIECAGQSATLRAARTEFSTHCKPVLNA